MKRKRFIMDREKRFAGRAAAVLLAGIVFLAAGCAGGKLPAFSGDASFRFISQTQCTAFAATGEDGAGSGASPGNPAGPFGQSGRADGPDSDNGSGVAEDEDGFENEFNDFDANDDFDDFGDFDEFDEFDRHDEAVFDPLRPYNRAMTIFNDRFYRWIMEPTASGYAKVVPEPVRRSVQHFFSNLGYPVRLVNNTLQLKGGAVLEETSRFLINSTMGVGGLFDPATSRFDLEPRKEDFGQTLGHYGLGSGFHVVIPILGPSNVRDGFGILVDGFLDPVYYIEGFYPGLAIKGVEGINYASLHLGEYERMTAEAIDLYIFLRNAYEQNREKQIRE